MIEIVNGHKYKVEMKRGHQVFHARGCRGRFKWVGFYKLPYMEETRFTYRCKCMVVSFTGTGLNL